ncbi:MAG: hypothetical protein HS107_07210 [Thermoflexaceae bacterium]|nr:hypothetical protein [Thermoflexaceae bacterium]
MLATMLAERGVQLALGIVLVRAGASKARAPWIFVAAVRSWGLLPERVAAPFVRGFVAVELSVGGGAVIAGLTGRGSAVASFVVFAAFVAFSSGLFLIRLRTGVARCGCGPGASMVRWRTVGRASALACVAIGPRLGYAVAMG